MEGKTTEEIIASLGSPEKIAEDLLVAYDESDFVQEVVEVVEHSVGFHTIEVDVDNANIILKTTDKEQPYLEVNDKDYLQLYSFISMLSFDIYMKKQLIESLIDTLDTPSKEKDKDKE